MKHSKLSSTVLFSAVLLGAACAAPPKEVTPTPAPTPATAPMTGGQSSSAIPAPPMQTSVKWTPPARWKTGAERPMRAATYLIPPAAGDKEEAECAVFVNIGGSVQANIDRWIGQFDQPDGTVSQDQAKTTKETINGFPVTLIDLSGTYKGMQQSEAKSSYRLLGAIVEAPSGLVYFKLTGPAKTVAAAQSEFQTLLKSLK